MATSTEHTDFYEKSLAFQLDKISYVRQMPVIIHVILLFIIIIMNAYYICIL